MTTKIIIIKGMQEIVEYDFIVPMSAGGIVLFEKQEYEVDSVLLDINTNLFKVFLIKR